jgi:hypothetical protein
MSMQDNVSYFQERNTEHGHAFRQGACRNRMLRERGAKVKAQSAWRVARGAWRVARGAWRVARGAWRVAFAVEEK